MPEHARNLGPFAHATREALESAVSRLVADALLDRALIASHRAGVPEDVGEFRAFVEGPLRAELARVLDVTEIALVLERIGNVLWMATSDVRALNVAKDWASARAGTSRESGSHPRALRDSERAQATQKRPTIPAPASSPPASSPPGGTPAIPRSARSPLPPRPPTSDTVSLRVPRSAATVQAMPRASAAPAPSAVMLLTLDPILASQTNAEVSGRCPVIVIGSPSDLARAMARAGDRVVVLIDTTLPSIDLPTFVGLSPILPAGARVVLWGADERQRARLVTQFPVARSWLASEDAREPGALALSLG